jgi:hypothetical protein
MYPASVAAPGRRVAHPVADVSAERWTGTGPGRGELRESAQPEPDRITVRTLAEVGSDRFATLLETCSAATLDRIDAGAMASMGSSIWAAAFLVACDDST